MKCGVVNAEQMQPMCNLHARNIRPGSDADELDGRCEGP